MPRRNTNRLSTAVAMLLLTAVPGWAQGDLSGESPLAGDSPLVELLMSQDWTRAEMAQRLLRALEVAAFQPEDCVAGEEMFSDVPASSPFCSWVEELVRRGLTAGCAEDRYCPADPVNRQQMAVFLVRAIEAAIEEVPEGPPGPQGPQGQQGPQGPAGPEGPPGPPTFTADCNEGLAPDDEMVRVGSVCIDKYEASVWDAPVGGNRLTTQAQIRALCPDDGQDCKGKIFARSVAGVEPARNITWFQAQQALANSGKRLPSNAEWQMAASGTPDGAPCVVSGGLQNTGANPGCVSDWGAFDMVGNVWEWVADWVPFSTNCPGWGDVGEFSSDDGMCLSGASTTVPGPGALIRGGDFADGSNAGPFAVSGLIRPSDSGSVFGFRGAR